MKKPATIHSSLLPITDVSEVEALLEELPIAVQGERFTRFVLGFPRKYLISTPRAEIVKHYLLVESLADRPVISSLAKEGALWKLCLVTGDRKFLFSRLAGTLSYFGMHIVTAEAFANVNSLVLDTFHFADRKSYFAETNPRQNFQHFLEEAVQGKTDLESLLKTRLNQVSIPDNEGLQVELDNHIHPSATRLILDCPDHFGLLYLVSRCISEEGHDIEMAYVETPGNRAYDCFYLSHRGGKLSESMQRELRTRLKHLGERLFLQETT